MTQNGRPLVILRRLEPGLSLRLGLNDRLCLCRAGTIMKITELCIRRSRSYLYKLTGSGVDLTLSDCDTFTPASQLMRLALYDEYPNTALSDQVSLDEPASDQASLEPWDEWQSWDDTDTYEDPGIPSIEMMLWEK